MASHSPDLLTDDQRALLTQIPTDLSDRELARYYTLTAEDLQVINRRRRGGNRLGFAVQLCMLRFPGRTITDLPDIPTRVLALIAQQVGVPPTAFASYGQRLPTIYEHLDEIRAVFGYRNYDWRAMCKLARVLLPQALESDRPLPLAAAALQQLRQDKVIARGITTIERLVWGVLRIATRRVERALTRPLTAAQRTQLDALLTIDPALARRRLTRLTWLRVAPGNPSVGQRIKKGILYAKEIGPLPDALFSPPQSEEQCCELDRSTARFLALESHREALAYDSPGFIR